MNQDTINLSKDEQIEQLKQRVDDLVTAANGCIDAALSMRDQKPITAGAPSIEGLTDQHIEKMWDELPLTGAYSMAEARIKFARAIEREVIATQSAKQGAQAEAWISINDVRKPVGRTPILLAINYVRYGEHEDGTPGEFHGQVVAEGEYVPQHGEVGNYFTCYSSPHGDSDAITHWQPLPALPGAAPAAQVRAEVRQFDEKD